MNTITVKTKRPTIRDLLPGQCFRTNNPSEPTLNGSHSASSDVLLRIVDRDVGKGREDPETRSVRLSDGQTFAFCDDTEVAAVFDLDIKATER